MCPSKSAASKAALASEASTATVDPSLPDPSLNNAREMFLLKDSTAFLTTSLVALTKHLRQKEQL